MFKQVDPKQDFIKLEHDVIDFWNQKNILEKYLKKNNSSKKRWSFLDGPITANNKMGVHHAWGRTLKDLWQRFYTMNGYKQRYQNGFDCQGLWVEVEVEKELGFKNKRDIEKYGIGKFVNKCKERVLKYSKIQTQQSKRLAEWMDWDNSYYTMSDENNYTIWHFLKVCYDNDWVYEGNDSVPWCPRCGTAISQHEMLTEEYKEITHDSIFFTLPITNGAYKGYNLLVWTTTPWTIPANVAVAVDPNKQYTIVDIDNKKLILLESRSGKVFGKKVKSIGKINGSELIGLNYEAPFSDLANIKETFSNNNHKYKVVASDEMILPVSEDEGTGLVHIAPGAGAEDFRLGKKYNLPIVNVIDEEARYLSNMGEFSGKNAKENPDIIFDYIKKKDNGRYFYKIMPYKHRYPTCWRCKTELVWRNVAEWYIAMDKKPKTGKDQRTFRQRMIEVAKKINWNPKWGLERELDWLNNMHDWLISKKRYWGLALPIWQCSECGHYEVIGSKEELHEKAVEGWDKFDGHSPHRPWVDEVNVKCEKCGSQAKRIKDVGNPWLDAGIVPFSTYVDPKTKKVSYLNDKKYWSEWFPADFVTECFPGQFKNWFYALIAMSSALEDTNPYKTLLGHALVKDERGEEMHKSKGNAIWFDEAAEEIGVDVMRWMYATHNPVQNLNFGYAPAQEVLRRFILTLWNTYSFFVTYANADKWSPDQNKEKNKIPVDKRPLLDQWILTRLDQTYISVDKELRDYNSYKATESIEDFVRDLSTWYLRLSRKRRDESFYQTMYYVLLNLSCMLSPFIPHISESIYQNLRMKNSVESIHLNDWPKIEKIKNYDKNILEQMEKVRQVVEIAHSIRRDESLKVRQPLSKLFISDLKLKNDDLLEIIKQEVNVKNIELVEELEKNSHISIKKEYHITVGLDIQISPELRKEGMLREIIRQVQYLRKKAGLKADDKMKLYWICEDQDIIGLIKESKSDIMLKTLSTEVLNKEIKDEKISKFVKIDNKKLYLAIK